jgi:polyisoprenoid-binding protein YceI
MSTITETITPGTYVADPVHSQVGFEVAYMVGTFRGTFSPFEATLEVGDDGGATLAGKTGVAGVKVQDENLTAHLQSPEFFDAERTPEISFSSRELRIDGPSLHVDGEITIKGESRPLHLDGTVGQVGEDPWGNRRVGITLSGSVDRTAFGLDWNNPLPSGEPALANEVTLSAELSLVKAQA